jgi:hypothetical protein
MKNLCITFEEWHLGDGNYPAFYVNEKAKIAFQLSPKEIQLSDNNEIWLRQNILNEYSFSGEVIYCFDEQYVVNTGMFSFYIEEPNPDKRYKIGDKVTGCGMIFIDYYIWKESFQRNELAGAPDIFYNIQVDRIRKVYLPGKFVHIYFSNNHLLASFPTSLSPSDYTEETIEEIDDIRTDDRRFCFYLLDLHVINEEIVWPDWW